MADAKPPTWQLNADLRAAHMLMSARARSSLLPALQAHAGAAAAEHAAAAADGSHHGRHVLLGASAHAGGTLPLLAWNPLCVRLCQHPRAVIKCHGGRQTSCSCRKRRV